MARTNQKARIVLAVDGESLRDQLKASLAHGDFNLCVLNSSVGLRTFLISEDDFILLDTGDDVAAMVQIVYELYRLPELYGYTLPIMAIASGEVIEQNTALALWLIDNHAAVTCVVPRESLDLEHLASQLERLLYTSRR